MNQRGCRS